MNFFKGIVPAIETGHAKTSDPYEAYEDGGLFCFLKRSPFVRVRQCNFGSDSDKWVRLEKDRGPEVND